MLTAEDRGVWASVSDLIHKPQNNILREEKEHQETKKNDSLISVYQGISSKEKEECKAR